MLAYPVDSVLHGDVIASRYKAVNSHPLEHRVVGRDRPPETSRAFVDMLIAERKRRAELGQPPGTLKEVAAAVGVTTGRVGQWETYYDAPTKERMEQWLRAFGFPSTWAAIYDDLRKTENIEQILQSYDPPLPREQLEAQRVALRNALRVGRGRG